MSWTYLEIHLKVCSISLNEICFGFYSNRMKRHVISIAYHKKKKHDNIVSLFVAENISI